MPKKTKKSGKKHSIIKDTIAEFVTSTALESVKSFVESLADRTHDFFMQLEKKIVQGLYASVVMICGLIFLLISLAFLLSEYLKLSKGWSFLILGLILIIIALVSMNMIKKQEVKF